MKVILVFSILFAHALARPRIFGEDGIVHKVLEKAQETGKKVQEGLHNAKEKVKGDLLIIEGKVHNAVVKVLKTEESEKHDDTKPHESKNIEDTENTSEKATTNNKDNTLGYKKPDVDHQTIGNGKVADDNTENSFDFEKINKLASNNDHRGTENQEDVYGNRNLHDDGLDQFHVVYDQNGKAIVVPNIDSSNTHSNMRHGTSVNHFNEHNSYPVNHDIYTDNRNLVENQPKYKLRRTDDGYIDRTAVARSGATARNFGSIDVRND